MEVKVPPPKVEVEDREAPKTRTFKGAIATTITVLSVLWVFYHILYMTGILSRLKIYVNPPQHLALHLGFILGLVFSLLPATKKASRKTLSWYDMVLIAVGFGWNLYLVVNFNDLLVRTSAAQPLTQWELVTVYVFFVVVLEAARRTVGVAMLVLCAAFLAYPLVTSYLPGMLAGPSFSLDRVARGIGLFVTGMYGSILNISATIVISFLLFGQLLFMSGAGQWFIDIANSLLGYVRGGAAKVAVVSSALMGTVQGTAVGNIATIGVITIPLMKNTGYSPHLAGAIEAVASNGGQIMPPVMGIAAFIMVDFLGVGYDKIVIAAILPAIIYFAAVYFTVDFEAAKGGLVGVPRSQLPRMVPTLVNGWYYLLPLATLLYFLLYLQYSPQLSAIYASAMTIIVSWFKRQNRITFAKIVQAMKETAVAMMVVATVCALAGIVTGSVQLTGLSYRLSFLLVEFAGGNLLYLLILTAVTSVILGMGMPTSAAYIVLAVLAAPALVKLGMTPMAAHFFVFYFGVAAIITPPVCPGSFVAAGIAGAPPMKTALSACRVGIACYVAPFIFAYHPGLLMMGPVTSIIYDTLLAALSVFALSAALGGYMFKPLNYVERAILVIGGLAIIEPSIIGTLIGVGVVVIMTIYQVLVPRLTKTRSQQPGG